MLFKFNTVLILWPGPGKVLRGVLSFTQIQYKAQRELTAMYFFIYLMKKAYKS